jgi:hypothetical protein
MKAMDKKKMVITASIIGVIIVVSGAILLKKRKKRKDLEKGILATVDPSRSELNTDLINWPLRYGSGYINKAERSYVSTVQQYLNKKLNESDVYSLPVLVVDGLFGVKTESNLSRIAGVKEVDMTLYNSMDSYLATAPIDRKYSVNE